MILPTGIPLDPRYPERGPWVVRFFWYDHIAHASVDTSGTLVQFWNDHWRYPW